MKITRGQLANIVSGNTPTRTMHLNLREDDQEITDKWIVRLIEADATGTLVIYCEAPEARTR